MTNFKESKMKKQTNAPSQSAPDAVTKHHSPVSLQTTGVYRSLFRKQTVWDWVQPSGVVVRVPGWTADSGLLINILTWQLESEQSSLGPLSRGLSPFLRTPPSWPTPLPEALLSDPKRPGLGPDKWVRGKHIHSILCFNPACRETTGLKPHCLSFICTEQDSPHQTDSKRRQQQKTSWKSTGNIKQTNHHFVLQLGKSIKDLVPYLLVSTSWSRRKRKDARTKHGNWGASLSRRRGTSPGIRSSHWAQFVKNNTHMRINKHQGSKCKPAQQKCAKPLGEKMYSAERNVKTSDYKKDALCSQLV